MATYEYRPPDAPPAAPLAAGVDRTKPALELSYINPHAGKVAAGQVYPSVALTNNTTAPMRIRVKYSIAQMISGRLREVYSAWSNDLTIEPEHTIETTMPIAANLILAYSCAQAWAKDQDTRAVFTYSPILFTTIRVDAEPTLISPDQGDTVSTGQTVRPTAAVRNLSSQPERCSADLEIRNPGQAVVWAQRTESKLIAPNEAELLRPPTTWRPVTPGTYTHKATSVLAGDNNPANDVLGPVQFTVTAPVYKDVKLVKYQWPYSGLKMGTSGNPSGYVKNVGLLPAAAAFRFRLLDGNGGVVTDWTSRTVTIDPGVTTVFPGPTITLPGTTTITVEAWALYEGDQNPADNHLGPAVYTLTPWYNNDMACAGVTTPEPGAAWILGTWHTVTATFANVGRNPMERGHCVADGLWKADKSLKLTAGRAFWTYQIVPAGWTLTGTITIYCGGSQLTQPGSYLVKTTYLQSDDNNENNTIWTPVTVNRP